MLFSRTDPIKRKSKKSVAGKRRSASYSPKSAKGQKKSNAGSGTDSDAEKKTKGRRRKSWASKPRNGSRDEDDDELEGVGILTFSSHFVTFALYLFLSTHLYHSLVDRKPIYACSLLIK